MPRRRQQDRSRITRAALITAGREVFAEQGYSYVSADQIVAAAGVSRGALQHHFRDKRGLFTAVLDAVEAELMAQVTEALDKPSDPWAGMVAALRGVLDQCLRPDVVQVALTDAPAVLGWQDWRDMEARHGLGVLTQALQQAADHRLLRPAPIPVLAQLLLSTVIEASLVIAHAEDPTTARDQAEESLLLILTGLRTDPE